MRNKEFIFCMTDRGLIKYEFADLFKSDSVQVIENIMLSLKNPLLKMLRKIHFSKKINMKFEIPFKGIWDKTLVFKDWIFKDNIQYYFLIPNSTLKKTSYSVLKKMRKENVKIVLLLTDAIKSKEAYAARRLIKKNIFDYIFSFDKNDSKEYGFLYTQEIYSMILDNNNGLNIKNDLCCIASNKGRIHKLHDIYEKSIQNEVKSIFIINDVKDSDKKYKEGIIYNFPMNYLDVLEKSLECNCLLEILSGSQSGTTLRYYEAICYNRKLLTNNEDIVNLPFYDPRYMKVFETPEDIDWEWVKERIQVDYGYDGRFSPVHILDKILELEAKLNGKR